MPWTREEKIFWVTYLETKSFKTVQAKFRKKFNDYPQKNQIYRSAHKFQATGSINNFKNNKKAENLWSGKMSWQYGCDENFCRKESEKVPPKTFPRTLSLTCIVG